MSPFESLTVGFASGLALVYVLRWALRQIGVISLLSIAVTNRNQCVSALVRELNRARGEILTPATLFSRPPVAAALLSALRRGVAVHLLMNNCVSTAQCPDGDNPISRSVKSLIETHGAIGDDECGLVVLIDRRTILSGHMAIDNARGTEGDGLLVIQGCSDLARAWASWFLADSQNASKPWNGIVDDADRQAA